MNEGFQYRILIDPLLKKAHLAAVKLIPEGSKVIDIACGNGSLDNCFNVGCELISVV